MSWWLCMCIVVVKGLVTLLELGVISLEHLLSFSTTDKILSQMSSTFTYTFISFLHYGLKTIEQIKVLVISFISSLGTQRI